MQLKFTSTFNRTMYQAGAPRASESIGGGQGPVYNHLTLREATNFYRTEIVSMWHPLIARDALAEGAMREIEAGGRPIVVALNGGRPYAFNALCPHASAELAGGDLRPTYVICPLHSYRYDLESGHCLKPADGPRLKVYPVEWRGEILWGDL